MNLKEVNNKLENLINKMMEINPEYQTIALKYEKRKAEILMIAPQGNQAGREAYTTSVLIEEGLHEEYENKRLDYRTLMNVKDLWIEVSKNLRILEQQKGGEV